MADPLAKPTETPVMEMSRQIRTGEKGREVEISSVIDGKGLTSGMKVRLYRMAERDIQCGKPAVFEMRILSVDPKRHVIHFNGNYKSGSGSEMGFTNHMLVILMDGAVVSSPPEQPGRTLYIKRSFEEALLFMDPSDDGVITDGLKQTHDSAMEPTLRPTGR